MNNYHKNLLDQFAKFIEEAESGGKLIFNQIAMIGVDVDLSNYSEEQLLLSLKTAGEDNNRLKISAAIAVQELGLNEIEMHIVNEELKKREDDAMKGGNTDDKNYH